MLSLLLVEMPYSYLSADEAELWHRHCIVSTMPWQHVTSFLRLDISAQRALVDAIVFLPGEPYAFPGNGYAFAGDNAQLCLSIVDEIRDLPENCCMSDGRKWKRIPCAVLTENMRGYQFAQLRQSEVPVVRYCLYDNYYAFGQTVNRLQQIVHEYHERVLKNYQHVGILVDFEYGRFRVRQALKARDRSAENEYYHSSADRRKLHQYVTVHRDVVGIDYDARVFEELINDPKTRERELHRFLEQNPAFLMDALRGIPISHSPTFASPKLWTPDFVLPGLAETSDDDRSVQIAELKGPHSSLLSGSLHRGFSAEVTSAINQVRDYDRVLRERHPVNQQRILDTFGYLPEAVRKAVVIGRTPTKTSDQEVLKQRMMEQPDVQIVPYDEILQVQQGQIQ